VILETMRLNMFIFSHKIEFYAGLIRAYPQGLAKTGASNASPINICRV
jgi:hypothetical protein